MTTARTIEPLRGPVDAVVRVPGSKSLTNRALVLAALSNGRTTLLNASLGDDCRDLARTLRELGYAVETRRDAIEILGGTRDTPARGGALNAGLGGTTTRFLVALAAALGGDHVIDAAPRMRKRPVADLLDALRALGAGIDSAAGGLPVRVKGDGLRGGRAVIAGDVSSQFLSALLLVAPTAASPVEIVVSGRLASRPYVDMTLAAMAAFGVQVERDGYARFHVEPSGYRTPSAFRVESDASCASYFLAMPAIVGGRVCVLDLSRASLQGDARFAEVLARIGCEVVEEGGGLCVTASRDAVAGIDVDLADMPDVAQTLAVVAPFASGETVIRGIASARLKECDRVAAVCEELRKLGAGVEEATDGMRIAPGHALHGGLVATYDDHRMAMAFSLLGLRVAGIAIENPACVSKSFPDFFDRLGEVAVRGD